MRPTKTSDSSVSIVGRLHCASALMAFSIALFGVSVGMQPTAFAEEPIQISDVLRSLSSGDLKTASESARRLDDAASQRLSDVDTTLVLTQVARGLERSGEKRKAVEFYNRALKASERPSADELPSNQIAMVQFAAGSSLLQNGQAVNGIRALAQSLKQDDGLSAAQKRLATKAIMDAGNQALQKREAKLAELAYTVLVKNGVKDLRCNAVLGQGWAIALQGDRNEVAATTMQQFIRNYPQHPNAVQAATACFQLWQRSGKTEKANGALQVILDRWPNAKSTSELIAGYASSGKELPPSIREWLVARVSSEKFALFDSRHARLIVEHVESEDAIDKLMGWIARSDKKGDLAADLLAHLSTTKRVAEAERFAASLLDPLIDQRVTPAAQESAARWAAKQERWTMLALASESYQPDENIESRTTTTERLFAEALMQSGRVAESLPWWQHLADIRKATDFDVMLRCAETTTTHGEIADAKRRIESARKDAGEDPRKQDLIAILSAEVHIRGLHFDDGRKALQAVVDRKDAVATVRARAQWLIGETFYLQRRFTDAIESYRQVDSIEPQGRWAAAALVQAGKSFEQLGRTRDAAVCYSTLIGQFADSQHAVSARKRLAAIDPATSNPNEPLRR